MSVTGSSSTSISCSPSSSVNLQHLISNLSLLLTIKLKNDNFLVWKSQFLTVIRAHRLQFLLDGTKQPPSEFVKDSEGVLQPNTEYIDWLTLDQQLLSCIFASVSENVLPYILHIDRSKDAWSALERKLSSLSRTNVLQLKCQIQTIMKGSASMSDYLQKIESITDTLVVVSAPIDEEDLVLYILNGLPPEYNAFKTVVRTRLQSVPVSKLQELLLIEEQQIQMTTIEDNSSQSSIISSAFSANFV